jgi:hypothetical protein
MGAVDDVAVVAVVPLTVSGLAATVVVSAPVSLAVLLLAFSFLPHATRMIAIPRTNPALRMMKQPPSAALAKRGPWAVALVFVAMVRMAATFTTFSQTTDESMHVGGGLEVLQDHTYQLMILNPPLPRIVMAVPQYLAGVRLPADRDFYVRTHAVFYNQLRYETNLAMARSGNLLFFALAAYCVWILTRRFLDDDAALIAVFLFTTQPIVMGYPALATHEASP